MFCDSVYLTTRIPGTVHHRCQSKQDTHHHLVSHEIPLQPEIQDTHHHLVSHEIPLQPEVKGFMYELFL